MMSLHILALLLTYLGYSQCQNVCPQGVKCTRDVTTDEISCELWLSSNYSLLYIEVCFNNSYLDFLTITSEAPGKVVFTIDSPIGARQLKFINVSPNGMFSIRASEVSARVDNVEFTMNGFQIDQGDFFNYFPHITNISTLQWGYLLFGSSPTFMNLTSLDVLQITVSNPEQKYSILTADTLPNNLQHFGWSGSLTSIDAGAFKNLTNLSSLDLSANFLTTLPSGLFNDTVRVTEINLNRNMIKLLSIDIFKKLRSVTSIFIDNNPNFPYESLQVLSALQIITLNYNSYTTLDPFPFQQLHQLKDIYLLGNPFNCDCDLHWAQFMSSSGVNVIGASCFSPVPVYSSNITDSRLYASCPSNETFPCFNKSIPCPNEFMCHNTGNTHLCSCEVGLALAHTNECIDVNECTSGDFAKCKGTCINTFGSYKCACDDGYRLESDDISCVDINECVDDNGGCEGGCRNIPGGFTCYCESGYKATSNGTCGIAVDMIIYLAWGACTSLVMITLILIMLIACFCLCCRRCSGRRGKSPTKALDAHPISSIASSYTRMDTIIKPDVPQNRPKLPPPRTDSTCSGPSTLQRPFIPIGHEELTYEAFDTD